MTNRNETYGLDSHSLGILNQYRDQKPFFEILKQLVLTKIKFCL